MGAGIVVVVTGGEVVVVVVRATEPLVALRAIVVVVDGMTRELGVVFRELGTVTTTDVFEIAAVVAGARAVVVDAALAVVVVAGFVVVVVVVVAAAATANVTVAVAVCAPAVPVMVMVTDDALVGVPEMTPVEEFRLRPAGRVPEVTE